ncbi:sensor histidine kinase [Cobetia sp. QF-1]|uniref:sensor histidine kinase n=1 Tax=Cobetia sp. QF-1 TaxID=1969833 RepID=UPI0020CD5F7E|nr:sensor histidine kinase [Cobetia sp. QF-1]
MNAADNSEGAINEPSASTSNRSISLYRRLLSWLLIPLLALGTVLLVQAFLSARDAADRAYDRLLEASLVTIAEQVKWQDGQLWLDLPPAALEMLATDAQERVFYSLVDADGEQVTGNTRLPDANTLAAGPHASQEALGRSGELAFRDIAWQGQALRLGSLETRLGGWGDDPRHGQRFSIRVAHTREGREALTRELFSGSLIRIAGMAVLALLVVLIGVRLALSPLIRLRRAIRERDPRSLAPLNLSLPRELEELRNTLNELLARMRRVRVNQERFIGDASHQLRTPLAGLSAHAELALRNEDPAAWHAALKQMQATASHTAHLASQLLSLTRLNNPEVQPERVPLELSALARATVSRHFLRCDRAGVDLGLEIAAEIDNTAWTLGVAWQLEEGLANLIDNACKHGAHIVTLTLARVATTSDDETPESLAGRLILGVEDDGPGIQAERRLLVLRPFHRHAQPDSESAPATRGGAGLGLAIVDGIARHHDARLTLSDANIHTNANTHSGAHADAETVAVAGTETGITDTPRRGLRVSLYLEPCPPPASDDIEGGTAC